MTTAAAGRDGEGADAVRLKTCSVSRANAEDFAPNPVLPVAWPCAAAMSLRFSARTSESVVVGAEDVLNKSPPGMLADRAGATMRCVRETNSGILVYCTPTTPVLYSCTLAWVKPPVPGGCTWMPALPQSRSMDDLETIAVYWHGSR